MSMFDENETMSQQPYTKKQKYEIELYPITNEIYFRRIEIENDKDKDTYGKEYITEIKFDANSEFVAWVARSLTEVLRRKWEYP